MTDKSCCANQQIQHPSHSSEIPHLNRVSGQIDGIKKMNPENPKSILVYYTADWCGPCRKFGPLLESKSKFINQPEIVQIFDF